VLVFVSKTLKTGNPLLEIPSSAVEINFDAAKKERSVWYVSTQAVGLADGMWVALGGAESHEAKISHRYSTARGLEPLPHGLNALTVATLVKTFYDGEGLSNPSCSQSSGVTARMTFHDGTYFNVPYAHSGC